MAKVKGPSKFDTGAPPKRIKTGDFMLYKGVVICMVYKVSPEAGATITSIEVWMGGSKDGRPITQSVEPSELKPYTGTVHAFEAKPKYKLGEVS